MAGEYTNLHLVTVASLPTCILACIPNRCVHLSLFHLPRLPSTSEEVTTSTSGYTACNSVDSRIRKCRRDPWRQLRRRELLPCFLACQHRRDLRRSCIVCHYITHPHLSALTSSALICSVNVFYRINQEKSDSADPETAKQEKEFKIGSIGFSDSSGIMLAALVSMPLELSLCAVQVERGKRLCRSL